MAYIHENYGDSFSVCAQWNWSPTAEDSGQGPGLTEGDSFHEMFSVEQHATVDDYSPPGLGHANEATYDLYEQNCPYRRVEFSDSLQPISKMFRLVEEFSDGLVYKGDSFGDHSYIDTDEGRECSSCCRCRLHDYTSEAFTFIAYKSLGQLSVAVYSIDLYSELIHVVGLGELQLEATSQGAVVDGLVLLKHYQTLTARLNALRSTLVANPAAHLLVSEMALLTHGFLLDGGIFKSYGYEDLYEDGFLTFDHWKEFQQVQLERDISALEEGYCEIDETDYVGEELLMPPDQADSPDLQAGEAHSVDIRMGNKHVVLFQSEPDLASASDAQSLPNTLPSPEIGMQFIPPPVEVAAEDYQGDRHSPRHVEIPLERLAEGAEAGHEPVVRLLLDWGAAVNEVRGRCSPTPLEEAVKAGHESVVRLLLDRGAAVDGVRDWYLTPLDQAVKAGHESVVRSLLDYGAAVDGVRDWYLKPLEQAAEAGHESIVRLLLDRGAAVNGVRDWYSSTPLEGAVKAGHESVVRLLLDYGAAVDGVRDWYLTPLEQAAEAGHESIVRLLLDRGAAVDGVRDRYSTPLEQAVKAGHESIVRLLLDRGAAVDGVRDRCSPTPLEKAAKAGHVSVARLLLDRGAAIEGVSDSCLSNVLVAEAVKMWLIRLLLGEGADALTIALSIARHSGRASLIRFIRKSLLQKELAARQSGLGDYYLSPENNDDPQDYIERRQRLKVLHKKFGEQYLNLIQEAKNSLTSFCDLGKRFQGHREAWAHGIRTLRRLCNGRPPRSLDDAIAFLCVSRAISETLDVNGGCDYTNQFLQDLDRWQILFKLDTSSLGAYREAVRLMWGVGLDKNVPCSEQAPSLETLIYFQALASTLVRQASGLLNPRSADNKGLESSQQRWRLRRGQNPSNSETSYVPLDSSHPRQTCAQPFEAMDTKPPDPGMQPKETPLRDEINRDESPAKMSSVVVLLMAGAIFAIVVLFLIWQRNASARVNCYSAMDLRDWESQQLDVKHAADNIINRLQQLTPVNVPAIAKLKTELGYVLTLGMVTRFSELERVFASYSCSSVLGCAEIETQAIKQNVQKACDYYEPVYTLQERYRTLETYLNLRSRLAVVSMQTPVLQDPLTASLDASNIASSSREFYFTPVETEAPRPTGTSATSVINQARRPSRRSPSTRRRTTFCQDCRRDFGSVSNYGKHRQDRHDGIRFYCRYCESHFSRKAYKDGHERDKHPRHPPI